MGMLLRRYHTEPEVDSVLAAHEVGHNPGPEVTGSLLAKDPENPVDEQEPMGTAKGGGKPAGNASREEWAEYAVAQGHFEGSLEDLTRNEIRDLFDK